MKATDLDVDKVYTDEEAMKSFSVSTIIQASPAKIWAILVDSASWPKWNTTVSKVEGKIALGEKVTIFTTMSPNQGFPLTVKEYAPEVRMTLSGGMPLGLFRGERTYTLTRQPDGSVEFSMQEVFSGWLAPLITRSVPDLQPSFEEFAMALKKQAEETGQ